MDNKTIYYRPAPPKPATLLIIEKDKNIRTIVLNGDMSMGRTSDGSIRDIPFDSKIVSRDHGQFIFVEGAYYYKDNGSLNGTFYNGQLLEAINERGSKAVKLNDGDVLRIDRKRLNDPHPEAAEIIFSTSFSAEDEWLRFSLKGKTNVMIGRNNSEGIAISDFMVSRNHARLVKEFGKWKIIDNNSTNGIAVNKSMIENERILNPFDVIRIANTSLIFLGDEIIYNNINNNKEFDYGKRNVIVNVNINKVTVRKHGSFGKKTLLTNINLDIEEGDLILILGGSGAGKSTFINSLLGEIRADGNILLEGMDLYKNFKILKHKIGLVPQFSTTRDNDTVYHTIYDAAMSKLSGEYSKAEIKERVSYIIKQMMLTSLSDMLIKNLSGGQKKRVEVAIQAIGNQQIFILDEPDSGMDTASRCDLMNNLKSCTKTGSVVAVISHSPDDAADLYDKVIVLAKSERDEVGRLAYYGDTANAFSFFGVNKLSEIVMELNYEGGKGRADEFIKKFEILRRG